MLVTCWVVYLLSVCGRLVFCSLSVRVLHCPACCFVDVGFACPGGFHCVGVW